MHKNTTNKQQITIVNTLNNTNYKWLLNIIVQPIQDYHWLNNLLNTNKDIQEHLITEYSKQTYHE